jgi:hypothetical protein
MGSIRELNEEEGLVEVEDDFELVTWDAVSDPSSQNAYFKEIRESRQLKESFNGRNVNPNNVDKLMQAIICELSGVCCIK